VAATENEAYIEGDPIIVQDDNGFVDIEEFERLHMGNVETPTGL